MTFETVQTPPQTRENAPSDVLLRRLRVGLQAADHVVVGDAWSAAAVVRIRAEAEALDAAGGLAPAAIGRGARSAIDHATRSDRTVWLDTLDAARTPALADLARELEMLRVGLNRGLLPGLDAVEAHLACYPPGARYARHRDRFADDDARVLSLVLYLNDDWQAHEGGALRLHLPQGPRDVLPASGTLVAFLSDRVEHEVLPATRSRWSVAAWFRRRAA